MSDLLLNGRVAEDYELAAIASGRECDLRRDLAVLAVLAGLLSEYPREPERQPGHVTDIEADFATARRRP